MGKILLSVDYDKSAVRGISTIENNAQRNTNNSARLRKDLTYFIPRQWVHDEEIMTSNGKKISKKVFVIGVTDDNQVASVTTLSVNSFRNHYGKGCDKPNLRIPCHRNGYGLWRADENAHEGVFLDGGSLIVLKKINGLMCKPIAFKLVSRCDVYRLNFEETSMGSGKWNVKTFQIDGNTFADLQKVMVNLYEEVFKLPEIEVASVIDDNTYFQGLD